MLSAEATRILAMGVLATLGVVLIFAVVRAFRRSPYTPAQAIVLGWSRLMTRIVWRAQISGPLPVGAGQGAVIICNHRCPFDPGFIALGVDRIMHWMVAREYCEHPFMGPFLRPFEPIPTNRGGIDTGGDQTDHPLRPAGRTGRSFSRGPH